MADEGRLQGKAALVTGGAQGIGRESALLFAVEGARVAVVDLNLDGAATVAGEITAAGGEAIAIGADVSVDADVAAMVAGTEEAFGALHVLFNNAGIMHHDDGDAQQTSDEVWQQTIDVNLKGVWLGCRHGIPALRRAGGGSIINTASFVAIVGAATPQIAYTASKGGVLAMTRELAVVHAREGIRVNALAPGPVDTDMVRNTGEAGVAGMARATFMGRLASPDEMVGAVLYMVSDASSFMTGQCLIVDGGLVTAR